MTAQRGSALSRCLAAACSLITLTVGARATAAPLPASSPSPQLKLEAERTVLPNGLEVILEPDHRAPIVAVNVWYHVGSKDEPEGRNGMAHLFEHLMFQGSKHVPENTFFRFLEKAGATGINGTTNPDRTNFYETVPANQLELALWLESDRMGFLLDRLDQRSLDTEREVVKNERRQNYEDDAYGLLRQYIRAELFPEGHPYHLLTIGTSIDIDAVTLADARAFFRRYYVPNNATLVLSGDFDAQGALLLIEKYFGPIPRGAAVLRGAPPPVVVAGETRIEVEAGVERQRVYLSWVGPPFFTAGDGDLDLVAHILAGPKSSRLYRRLVYELQIAQSVFAWQASMELASAFEIVATAKPGHTAQELLVVIDEEIARLRTDGITEEELGRAKAVVFAENVFEIERCSARANRLNTYNHYVGDPDYLAADADRTVNATTDSVVEAARTWLKERERVVAIVSVSDDAPVAGRVVKTDRGGP